MLDSPFDVRALPGARTEDLNPAQFRTIYLPAAIDLSVLVDNDRPLEHKLSSLGLTDPWGLPTVLGLLLVGFDPTNFLPGAYLQFVRFDGTDMDAPVLDERELPHNVVDLAARLELLLRGHVHTRLVGTSDFREERHPDYPLVALREACMNALMHRNYESSHAPVRVMWFSDRVEITNPGGPYGQVRSGNFDRVNDYRNPSLAGAMQTLGYVDKLGRGVRRIYSALGRNGNPPPEFSVDETFWSLIMRSAA